MMKVYVLYFNEWSWDEGDENTGHVLGVYNEREFAENDLIKAKESNKHGDYFIKKAELNKFYICGC
uniref:Uncharacterized protein n=1 Tax=viral metagenome TaxID=1070528 RepID=A0A6M3KVQ0_9ZZZZ